MNISFEFSNRKAVFFSFAILASIMLVGCAVDQRHIVSGKHHPTEFDARDQCSADAIITQRWREVEVNGSYGAAGYQVEKLPNGDWLCKQVFGSVLEKQKADFADELAADRAGLSLEDYRIKRAKEQEDLHQAYLKMYEARYRQQEAWKKDGKLHSHTYTNPDGSIEAVTVHGDYRCQTDIDESGADTTCN